MGLGPVHAADATGITSREYPNRAQKYVVSSTLTEPECWTNMTVLAGLPDDAVRRLKHEPGGDIVVTGGSIMLVHRFIAADLVDAYRLYVYSVVIESGRRLFQDDPTRRAAQGLVAASTGSPRPADSVTVNWGG